MTNTVRILAREYCEAHCNGDLTLAGDMRALFLMDLKDDGHKVLFTDSPLSDDQTNYVRSLFPMYAENGEG
jgi:3-oxoacyl-ACP reductase-like protein